jgi:ACS family hexuronate transporter-like MFS transporter
MRSRNTRWFVLALVFAAAILNYIDRQIIAILKPVLEEEFGWSDRDYGHLASAFQFAAASAYLGAGWFIDRMGLRIGYPLAVGVWSLAAAAHALTRTVGEFIGARVVLGAAEAIHTPAAVKSIAVWFPIVRERSLAFGIMTAASNLGAIITPLLIPVVALAFGWRSTFVIAGALGLVWIVLWRAVRMPDDRASAESATDGGPPEPAVPWTRLLKTRGAWAIAGAKLLIDAVWWFVLFWVPDFFHRVFGLDMREAGPPVALIYAMAAVGSFTGGWFPGLLHSRGLSLNLSRKGVMLACALIVLPLPLVLQVDSYWVAAVMIGCALAAHQGFSTNVFALTADVFPARVVGSVIGLGALFGNIGGLTILEFTGWVLSTGGSYLPMFLFASGAYLAALLLIHLLLPRLEPVDLRR